MSQDGQCAADDADPSVAVFVCTFPMDGGVVFDWHTHPDHQIAWAASGVLSVRTATDAWVLPPTRALSIPAGLKHETLSTGSATMRSAYIRPRLCPIEWTSCTPVAASPLLAEHIGYLEDASLDPGRRGHAETMLVDLLQPVAMNTIDVRMPAEERSREVADALSGDPADGRTLAQWGRVVGASERTLARGFAEGTGLPFGRWRSLLRLRAAMPALAAGESVGKVARQVGYESASAFVAAFRRETGVTPARYFHN